MGTYISKEVVEIVVEVAKIAIPLALKALQDPSALRRRVPGRAVTLDDLNDDLQKVVNLAKSRTLNDFGDNFKYVWNGQNSKPPNWTGGIRLGGTDFVFYDQNNPSLANMQQYVLNILQPLQGSYDTDDIALDINNAITAIFNGPAGAWVSSNKSYIETSQASNKTVEVDIQFFTFNSQDDQGNKLTFISLAYVIYNTEPLAAAQTIRASSGSSGYDNFPIISVLKPLAMNSASYTAKDAALANSRCFIMQSDEEGGQAVEISQEAAGVLKQLAPHLVIVTVIGVTNREGQRYGNISGSTRDTRQGGTAGSWKNLWITATADQHGAWTSCAEANCTKTPLYGGHTFFLTTGTNWYIVPLCATHNATTYDGNDSMTARTSTLAVQINSVPLASEMFDLNKMMASLRL